MVVVGGVLETEEEESWNKRDTQPCQMLKQEVRFTHSFHKDLLNIYDVAGTIPSTKRH